MRGRFSLRSWMFIYAGLIASIAMASQPMPADDQATTDPALRPAISDMAIDMAMRRSDI